RKPYSVILLDEIEKAHPDAFNILLQVLDDGRLTDSKGRVVNFKNTIVIMTSNLGSQIIQENYDRMKPGQEMEVYEQTKVEVMVALRSALRPEFLNRVDESIVFTPLQRNQLDGIVRLQLRMLAERLRKSEIEIRVTTHALQELADRGFDPQYGARPVKRVIQKEVMNELSKYILSGRIDKTSPVVLDIIDGHVLFRKEIEGDQFVQL
ncbi:MAG: AAA family ATPase, partial [Flavobacteriales bacterium]